MSSRLVALLLLGALAAACSDTGRKAAQQAAMEQTPADSAATARAALDTLRADYVSAYNAHNAAAVAALFSDSSFGLWADGTITSGPAEVQAYTQRELAASPTLSIDTGEVMVFGDHAVTRGGYTVTMPAAKAGSSPVSVSGSYMTAFKRVNGAWKIDGVLTNFSAPPPAGVQMHPDTSAPPPDRGTMTALTAAWTKAFNAADWPALAGMYTSDAVAAFSNTPVLQGRDSIQARFTQRYGTMTKPHIELHDVGTLDLSPDYAVDGGWYRLTGTTPQGKIQQGGIYFNLVQKQADGSWKLRWNLSNGQPKPAT